ncbi:hypothetical protein MsAm2_05500 [Methanolapillus ohkumae]|uniref:Radical SAM core domain-containing protein n=1 Tax=Methanolapillus ohkumae TaxID=3028298 RepID=A0AA96V5A6_9EURY|nr:hypothetical protein MsAm2_05500 [Methanosarcinaceae archaeon Am2]
MLHPLFNDMLEIGNDLGFEMTMITNGSMITAENINYLAEKLKLIGISVDSSDEQIQLKMGRGCGSHVQNTLDTINLIKNVGIPLKINTVVTLLNYQENMKNFIEFIQPQRWKVFQYLPILNQNDKFNERFQITDFQFKNFQKMHKNIRLVGGILPVFESNEDMTNSYLMISPSGKIVSNIDGKYDFKDIKSIGKKQFADLIDFTKYTSRGSV